MSMRPLALTGLLLTTALTLPLSAAPLFDAPSPFTARVTFSGAERGPIYAGKPVEIAGQGFAAGQTVQLSRGLEALTAPLKADAEGKISARFDLPAEAQVGLHSIVVTTQAPYAAGVADLKISPELPYAGAEMFAAEKIKVGAGLYQAAHSAKNDVIFVTGASGRPPIKESSLSKVDANTLEVLASVTPAEAPEMKRPEGAAPMPAAGGAPAGGPQGPGVFAVYGVGVDDANDTVWTTNTRQNTVAVYAQSDLSLVKQLAPGAVNHPRDVVMFDGRAYVSAGAEGVVVFDAKSFEKIGTIAVPSRERGGEFTAMSLALDAENAKLYTVSLTSPEAARIDLAAENAVEILAVPAGARGTGVEVDPATGTIFVASQDSDDVIALDASGKVLYDVAVGAGPLGLAYHAASKQLFVASRGSDSLAVLEAETGKLNANLDAGSFPNFVDVTAEGEVILVNKSRGPKDAEGDQLHRITLK